MNLDPKVIKKQIQAEAQLHPDWGLTKLWIFVLEEIFQYDISSAKEFMTSEHGGFTEKQIDRVVSQRKLQKKLWNQKLYTGRAEAF